MKSFRWLFIAFLIWGALATASHAGPGGWDALYVPILNGPVYTIAIQSDGKALIGGGFSGQACEDGDKLGVSKGASKELRNVRFLSCE